MIGFRSLVEYVGEAFPNKATAHLKGRKGIVTGTPYTWSDEGCFVEVTFTDGSGTRFLNIENLKEISN